MTYQRFDVQNKGRTVLTPATIDSDVFDESVKLPIQAVRESLTMSVLDLAHRAGMLPQHVQAIEAGLSPTAPELQALAAALNVPVKRLG